MGSFLQDGFPKHRRLAPHRLQGCAESTGEVEWASAGRQKVIIIVAPGMVRPEAESTAWIFPR